MGVPKPKDESPKIFITEGIAGTWFYHLSPKQRPFRSLCGEEVMPTSLPLNTWGMVTHLKERYCKKCYEAYVSEHGKEIS